MTDLVIPDAFEWSTEPWGRALRCVPLGRIARHVFTTRDLPLEPIGEPRGEGWVALGRSLGVPAASVLRLRQVHGAASVVVRAGVGSPYLQEPPPEADILATDHPDVALSVRVADCAPILLADERSGIVAAVHAGWRGTAARAVQSVVRTLVTAFGSKPSDLVAAIGPSIGPCCYRVGVDVVDGFALGGTTTAESARWFSSAPAETAGRAVHQVPGLDGVDWEFGTSDFRLPAPDQLAGFPGQWVAGPTDVWADLWTANLDQLVSAGVAPGSIHLARLCTACHRGLFHSYRADRTSQRTVAAIRMRPLER